MVPAWYQIIANIASIAGVLLLVPHREALEVRGFDGSGVRVSV
jgi:hypothetical protein